MDSAELDRRLAAVVALDVVGFSALMHRDEVNTLGLIRQLQTIVSDAVASRKGRVFKLTGDGALAEFPSVISAFDAARAVLQKARQELPAVQLRVGIHLGDLLFVDGDVFGDGVNVAARLEGQARPNTIAVSERAWHDLRQSKLHFEDLGPTELRNISMPVRVFLHDPGASLGQQRAARTIRGSSRRRLLTARRLLMALLVSWATAVALRGAQNEGVPSAFTETGVAWASLGDELLASALVPLYSIRFATSPEKDIVSILLLISSLVVLACYVLLARSALHALRTRLGGD